MKNIFKNSISLLLILTTVLCMFGCKDKEGEKVKKVRYSEDEISLPDDIKKVYDIKNIDDAISIICKDNDDNLKSYVSADKKTWSKKVLNFYNSSDMQNSKDVYSDDSMKKYSSIDAAISNNENTAYINFDKEKENNKDFKDINLNFDIFDRNNKNIKLDIGKDLLRSFTRISFFDSTDVFGITKSNIYQYDSNNGKLKFTYDFLNQNVLSVCSLSEYLYVATTEGVIEYNLNTHEKIGEVQNLKEYIDKDTIIFKGIGSKILLKNSKGLFRYSIDSKEVEKIMDIDSTLLSDTSMQIQNIIEYYNSKNEYEYLILYKDLKSDQNKLYKYTYSDELSNKDLTVITVYSLYEDDSVNQLLRMYERENEGVTINYVVGMNDSGSITETDAIKKLNTEIMAGKGPDILFLDGMNTEYYEKKHILQNVDDILSQNKDSLFNNITNTFYNGKKVFKVPLGFNLPYIMGKNTSIDKVNDLTSLSKVIDGDFKSQDVSVLNVYSPEDIINLMYYSCSKDFINNNKINQGNIKMYLQNCKSIYDICKSKVNKKVSDDYNKQSKKYAQKCTDKYRFSRDVYLQKDICAANFLDENFVNFDIGYMRSINDISSALSVSKEKGNISINMFTGNGEKSFLPKMLVGLNSKGKNKKLSKEILTKFISDSYQKQLLGIYFPINKNVFNEDYKSNINNNQLGSIGLGKAEDSSISKECKIKWINESEYNDFYDLVSSVDSSVNTDIRILDPIVDYGSKYILGEIDLDEAIDSIDKDAKIKLEE